MVNTAPTNYFYNPINGFYAGSIVAPMDPNTGVYATPANSTTVSPPNPGQGDIAVWNTTNGSWSIVSLMPTPQPAVTS